MKLARLIGSKVAPARDNDRAPYLASVMQEALAHLRCGKIAAGVTLMADALEDYTDADGSSEKPFQ